jgi:hypothetical protein
VKSRATVHPKKHVKIPSFIPPAKLSILCNSETHFVRRFCERTGTRCVGVSNLLCTICVIPISYLVTVCNGPAPAVRCFEQIVTQGEHTKLSTEIPHVFVVLQVVKSIRFIPIKTGCIGRVLISQEFTTPDPSRRGQVGYRLIVI